MWLTYDNSYPFFIAWKPFNLSPSWWKFTLLLSLLLIYYDLTLLYIALFPHFQQYIWELRISIIIVRIKLVHYKVSHCVEVRASALPSQYWYGLLSFIHLHSFFLLSHQIFTATLLLSLCSFPFTSVYLKALWIALCTNCALQISFALPCLSATASCVA